MYFLFLLFWTSAKAVTVCLCVDSRCALPCDEDVPCVYSYLPFCTICIKGRLRLACCQTFGQLTGNDRYKGPPMDATTPVSGKDEKEVMRGKELASIVPMLKVR